MFSFYFVLLVLKPISTQTGSMLQSREWRIHLVRSIPCVTRCWLSRQTDSISASCRLQLQPGMDLYRIYNSKTVDTLLTARKSTRTWAQRLCFAEGCSVGGILMRHTRLESSMHGEGETSMNKLSIGLRILLAKRSMPSHNRVQSSYAILQTSEHYTERVFRQL